MRPTPARLALACALLASAATRAGATRPDDSVVVIRGSSVSVERPLTPESVRDGSARVEVVRVRPTPEPETAPPPEASEAPPPVVVVVAPAPAEPEPVAIAWWPWVWPSAFPHHRLPPRRLAPAPFTGIFAPHSGSVCKFLHGGFGRPAR
jgi:hypothetical protein